MAAQNMAPVIIKRKKVISGGGHHGGAWKVAMCHSLVCAAFLHGELCRVAPTCHGAVTMIKTGGATITPLLDDLSFAKLAAHQPPLNAVMQQQLALTNSGSLDHHQSVEGAAELSKFLTKSETQEHSISRGPMNIGALLATEGSDFEVNEAADSLTPQSEKIEAIKQETRQTPSLPANLPANASSLLAPAIIESQHAALQPSDEVAEFAPTISGAC